MNTMKTVSSQELSDDLIAADPSFPWVQPC